MTEKYRGCCPMCDADTLIIFNDNQAYCHTCALIDPDSIELTDLDKEKLEFLH